MIYGLYPISNVLSLQKLCYIDIKKYIFSQKFPAVANGKEQKESDDDDEEESLDDTVVDPEEVNVHDKLIWDYMCLIHCYVHVE